MIVQMLIAELRDRYALAECLQAYTERIGPLLAKAQGLHAAYLAGEEGDSTLAIVTIAVAHSQLIALYWVLRSVHVGVLLSGSCPSSAVPRHGLPVGFGDSECRLAGSRFANHCSCAVASA